MKFSSGSSPGPGSDTVLKGGPSNPFESDRALCLGDAKGQRELEKYIGPGSDACVVDGDDLDGSVGRKDSLLKLRASLAVTVTETDKKNWFSRRFYKHFRSQCQLKELHLLTWIDTDRR